MKSLIVIRRAVLVMLAASALYLAFVAGQVYQWKADATPAAVCSTDADCARYEAAQHIPEAERCYGAPCPATVSR